MNRYGKCSWCGRQLQSSRAHSLHVSKCPVRFGKARRAIPHEKDPDTNPDPTRRLVSHKADPNINRDPNQDTMQTLATQTYSDWCSQADVTSQLPNQEVEEFMDTCQFDPFIKTHANLLVARSDNWDIIDIGRRNASGLLSITSAPEVRTYIEATGRDAGAKLQGCTLPPADMEWVSLLFLVS